ncbi:MAG: hypothetical protein ACXAC7_06635 [Candidatus Hodarchaeales archaeon]|jgi:hypothetical protein
MKLGVYAAVGLAIIGLGSIGGGVLLNSFINSMITKYYFWNLSNSKLWLSTGATPDFDEQGPYVFRQYDTKLDVSFNDDEVSYKTYTYYVFDESLSSGKLTDKIININPAYLGVIAGAGSETALLTSFVGPTLAQVMGGIQTTFMDGVLAQGVGSALNTIVTGFQGSFVDGVVAQAVGPALETMITGFQGSFVDGVVAQGVGPALETMITGFQGDFVDSVVAQAVGPALETMVTGFQGDFVDSVVAQAVGPALDTMVTGFQDNFVPQVQVLAVPDVLTTIQVGTTDTFYSVVNGTTAAQIVNSTWGGIADATNNDTAYGALFNDTDLSTGAFSTAPVQGISENATSGTLSLDFTLTAAERILHDGIIGIPGWLTDLSTGTGVLYYLQAYQNAMTNGTFMTELSLAYNATPTQLGAAASYLMDHIIRDIVPGVFFANNGLITADAANYMFYEQWANATVQPGGIDINDDGSVPDGFEVGIPTATGINLTTAMNLFDPTNPYSLTNETGIQAWFGAALGNTTLQGLLNSTFLTNTTQLIMIFGWLDSFKDNVVPPALIEQFSPLGVTSLDDIAFLQWGSSIVTSGDSVYDIDPTSADNYPEFWAWAEKIASLPHTFDATTSKALLNGTNALFNGTNSATFLALYSDGNFSTINALWGLNATEATLMAGYFQYLMTVFVPGPLIAQFGVTNLDDLGFMQWGSSNVTSGLSVYDIDPTSTDNYPEFWAWAEKIASSPYSFNATFSETLLNGTNALFNGTNTAIFLTLYSDADFATIDTLWGLNATEATLMAGYFQYLMSVFVPDGLIAQFGSFGVTELDDLAYLQWGTSIITSGLSVYDIDPTSADNYPEFWAWAEKNASSPYSFNATISKALLNGTAALFNGTNTATLLSLVSGSNFSIIDSLWGLNATEATLIAGYFQYLMSVFVPGPLVAQFASLGVTELDDLAYMQWGNSNITSGKSIYDLDPTAVPNYPEFWSWAEKIASSPYTFNTTYSKELLTGTYELFNGTNTAMFLALFSASNFATINAFWGLNTTEATLMAGYFQYLMSVFVPDGVVAQFAPFGVTQLSDLGFLQWGSPVITGGDSVYDLDPTAASNYPEFWAFMSKIYGTSYSFDATVSKALLNGTFPLFNGSNSAAFLSLVSGGNFSTINAMWGLDTTQTIYLATYFQYLMEEFVPDGLVAQVAPLGVSNITDVPYLHWGNPAITSGVSIYDLDPTAAPNYPEFWAWATNINGTPASFDAIVSKSFFTGPYNFTDTTNVGTFLTLMATGGFTAINTMWGLSPTEAVNVAGYLSYIMSVFIGEATLGPIFDLGGGLITTRTINEWLWDYNDPLLAFLQANADPTIDPANNFFTNHTSTADAELEKTSTYNTGKNDIAQIGQYVEWKENTSITMWAEDVSIDGTDATQFAPGVSKDDVLTTYVSDLLRSVHLVYQKDVEVEKIKLLRFILDPETLKSSSENADMAKYYQGISGMANMSVAKGIPLFLSKPHFLNAESSLSETANIRGMSPDPEKHETVIDVEPISGATMNAAKRLQISVMVNKTDFFYTNIADSFMPIMWIEEGGSIPADSASDFRDSVYGAQSLSDYSLLGGSAVGIVSILGAVITGALSYRPSGKPDEKIETRIEDETPPE